MEKVVKNELFRSLNSKDESINNEVYHENYYLKILKNNDCRNVDY